MTWDRPTWAMVRCQGLWYSRSSAAVVKWWAQGWQAQLLWNHVPNTTWDHRPRCWPNLLPQLGFISPPRSPRQIKENSFLSKQRLLKRPVTVPPGNRIPICWLALEREEMGLFSFLPHGLKTGSVSREDYPVVTEMEIQSRNSKNLMSSGGRNENPQAAKWDY